MIRRSIIVLILLATCPLWAAAQTQTKTQIIDAYIDAFNRRDMEAYLEPLDDSVRQFKFPDKLVEKSKNDIRVSYTQAFNAKELDGQVRILDRLEMGDIYLIEQSLQRGNFQSVDQYILFKFRGSKILEIYYLPKNFNWPKFGAFDK